MSEEVKVTEPTEAEQAIKIATECQEAAEAAFVTQMQLMGKTPDQVKAAFANYTEVQVKRASRYENMVEAIIGNKEETPAATE